MPENKNLSIVFITNNWLPYSAGVVSSINAFRKELQWQGHTVTIITLDFTGKRHECQEGVIRLVCPIRFRYADNPMAIPFFSYWQITQVIKELKPDIIHVHHPFLLGASALKVAKRYAIPCIFTYHTLYENYTHYVPLPQRVVKWVVGQRVAQFCAEVDGVVCPSWAPEQLLEKFGVATKRVRIPSPVQSIFLGMQCIQKRKGTRFHLITVSRFVKEKNIPFLLRVFQRLNPTKYTFTLIGFGAQLKALQSYAYDTLSLSKDTVRFVVKPSHKKLLRLYREADVFIFSSQSETQGLVLAEAMACGTPVVALRGPGQEDIVVDGYNGYLIDNEDEMIECIERIARNKTEHAVLQDNALETAKNYRPTILTHALVAFYRSFL